MPLSDFYASTIIKVSADFGFDGFECTPDEITRTLGLKADEVRYKGQERSLRSGRTLVNRSNMWALVSRSTSKDVNEHLRDLLSRLAGVHALIDPTWGPPSFSVLWKGNYLYAGSGPFYEADVLRGIAELNADLYQDIYQEDQDDSEIEVTDGLRRIPPP